MPPGNTAQSFYYLVPEVMYGASKKVMIHADAFLSNQSRNFTIEGGSVYMKYRFLSNDDVQKHFRMAATGRISFNNSIISQEDINLYGNNSGFEAGIIATQLLHKTALSSGMSFSKATDNGNGNKNPFSGISSNAINYTLSIGQLVLPKEYTDYKQTNLNLMVEFLNQLNLGSGKYYVDIAPSAQLIINSVARVDLGYRQALGSTLSRKSSNSFLLRLEYNFFNAFR